MLEHDYLIRLMVAFAAGLRRALELHGKRDNASARFALEETIGTAADMDPEVLLALEPASMAAILSLGAMDASAAEYIVHALMLDADYLEGDVYFKTHRSGQNLDRTRTQFELVRQMEEQDAAMQALVK